MKAPEKKDLLQVVLFESAKRFMEGNVKKEDKLRKFSVALRCCEAIEVEEPLFKKARLFTEEVTPLDRSNEGYGECPSVEWLHNHGSFEAQMEVRSILREKYSEVREKTQKIIEDYLANQS